MGTRALFLGFVWASGTEEQAVEPCEVGPGQQGQKLQMPLSSPGPLHQQSALSRLQRSGSPEPRADDKQGTSAAWAEHTEGKDCPCAGRVFTCRSV
jgi:hypothetical protein